MMFLKMVFLTHTYVYISMIDNNISINFQAFLLTRIKKYLYKHK